MELTKLKKINGLLTDLNLMDKKSELVQNVTDSRTDVLEEMNALESNGMIILLGNIREERVKNMRAKIIHHLCLFGMTDEKGHADYPQINDFIKNIGARNPKKRKLYNLSPGEMRDVLTQIEVMTMKKLHEARG